MAEVHHAPITSPTTYYKVFAGLMVLTALTVTASFMEIGDWHIAVGLAFGAAKATLVALFFMHLLHCTRLVWLVMGAGLFWLGIMLSLTLTDYYTRPWLTPTP
jgi:cytochrome c oxidase subunit 4